MTITLAWHELISWATTLVSLTLLVAERRRNDSTRYYMVLQGILRAMNHRAGFLVHVIEGIKGSHRDVPRDEVILALESEYINYQALQEHVMGSMKSLQPERDAPFSTGEFVQSGQLRPPASAPPAR